MTKEGNLFHVLGKVSENYTTEEITDHLLCIEKNTTKRQKIISDVILDMFGVPINFLTGKKNIDFDKRKKMIIKLCITNLYLLNYVGQKKIEDISTVYGFKYNTVKQYISRIKQLNKNPKFDKDIYSYLEATEKRYKKLILN